jgi:hypothetical protein
MVIHVSNNHVHQVKNGTSSSVLVLILALQHHAIRTSSPTATASVCVVWFQNHANLMKFSTLMSAHVFQIGVAITLWSVRLDRNGILDLVDVFQMNVLVLKVALKIKLSTKVATANVL